MDKQNDDHIVHLPEPFDFEVGSGYDYLREGPVQTAWYVIFRTAATVLLAVFNRAVYGIRIKGLNNLRAVRDSGAIAVCNHVHLMDCTFIDALFPFKRVYYTTLESNFRIPLARHLIRWLGGIPIPTKFAPMADFSGEVKRALERGSIVCVYPEGVLNPYYHGLRRFRDGAFKLAASAGCPVLPLVITFREPRGIYRLYKRKPCVTINILPAVTTDPCENPREEAKSVMEECYCSMNEFIAGEAV